MNFGWQCPRCGATHAPWVARCCGPSVPTTYTADSTLAHHTCDMDSTGRCRHCHVLMGAQPVEGTCADG